MDDASRPLELWGGIESTVNRVQDRWFDQIRRTGHEHRLDDLDRFATLGVTALRYPALWERVAPVSLDAPDWRWLDDRLERLQRLRLRPILGLLHHGSGPGYTSLLDPRFPELLSRFARMVAERYPWVCDYTPVNEPLTTARFSALYGLWFPHERSDAAFVKTLVHQCRGIVLAMKAIREVNPAARLIQTEDCGDVSGIGAVRPQVEHEHHRRWLTWDLLAGRVTHRHPLYGYLRASGLTTGELGVFSDAPCPPDIVGLNYYLTSDRHLDVRRELYPSVSHGDNGHVRYADVEAVRVRDDGITGHEAHLLSVWQRYGLPLAVTEAHLACTREEQARWLVESWTGAQWARGRGADVRAVTTWALLGSYDWDSLVTRDEGRYEPGVYDVRAAEPRPTFLAPLVRELAAGRLPSHPLLESPGWWRRPERLLHPRPAPAAVAEASRARPLLIVGASDGLGAEFGRACRRRGIIARFVLTPAIELADPESIEAGFREPRPWAAVNTLGWDRLYQGHLDLDVGWRLAVTGPAMLALACQRYGARLLTFSGDFAFDDQAGRAYTEIDRPVPLTVHGQIQAESEARVFEIAPEALIVRTGPLFGPYDDGNMAANVRRALSRGERLRAADDRWFSPTYDHDVVNAALDVLIDGERGIWHLANVGAVTSFGFCRRVAEEFRLSTDSLEPVSTSAASPAAARPAGGVLTSARAAIMRTLDEALRACAREARLETHAPEQHSCPLP